MVTEARLIQQACQGDPSADCAATRRPTSTACRSWVRRSARFCLAQHDDPAVVDLFEAILLD